MLVSQNSHLIEPLQTPDHLLKYAQVNQMSLRERPPLFKPAQHYYRYDPRQYYHPHAHQMYYPPAMMPYPDYPQAEHGGDVAPIGAMYQPGVHQLNYDRS